MADEESCRKHPALLHILASNRWSGVERYALDLCRHFSAEGWDVSVLTRDARVVDAPFRESGIKLRHAPLTGYFDMASSLRLAQILRAMAAETRKKGESPQETVIHVHRYRDALRAIVGRCLSRRKDVRIVMTLHTVRRGHDSRLYRFIYRNLDAHIFVSEKVRGAFLSAWTDRPLPFDSARLHTIHNSLALEDCVPVSEPSKGPVVAMYHGRLAPGKGLETLIRALPLLAKRTLRLRIVGSGNPDYVDSLRTLAQRLEVMDSIDWFRHTDDPLRLIADCHFGVLPSEDAEAFGLANLEYMACGRPQVCTSNGAQSEYLQAGTDAFIIPPGDPEALADAMRTLARDPGLRQQMGQKAREGYITRLSWRDFTKSMSCVYNF